MDVTITDVPKKDENILKKLWMYRKYMNVEPFVFFHFISNILNSIALQNFPLKKACRVNFNYTENVCKTIQDKDKFGVNCEAFIFKNLTELGSGVLWNVTNLSPNFKYTVCKAEIDAQTLSTQIEGIRAPIAAIFPLIVALFAGGWSDRYNKRKPFLMFPVIGEGLSSLLRLISAIFFDSIPMEFSAYTDALVPAMFGGSSFLKIAVFGYIAAATPEAHRIFRFSIFSIFFNIIIILGQPVSGILYRKLGYVNSFAMSCLFQVIAFLYVFFFIDEIRTTSKNDKEVIEGITNPGFENAESYAVKGKREVLSVLDEAISTDLESKKKKSCLAEFFDPSLAIECLKMPFIKRPNYGQAVLILLIIAFFLGAGPEGPESDYWYKFTQKQLNWNGDQISLYFTFNSVMAIVGIFIGTAFLSKLLKVSSPMIGIISALSFVISRPIYAFARNSITIYAGCLTELFGGMRTIAIKTIGSSIVDGDELSRLFSIFGICDPISLFIFPPLYSYVYQSYIETFPGLFLLFSELFYIPNVIVFIICYILLKKKKDKLVEDGSTNKVKGNTADQNDDTRHEITNL